MYDRELENEDITLSHVEDAAPLIRVVKELSDYSQERSMCTKCAQSLVSSESHV